MSRPARSPACLLSTLRAAVLIGFAVAAATAADGRAEAPSSGGGPNITRVTDAPSPQPRAGAGLPVTAIVQSAGSGVGPVTLTYRINYGPETTIPMSRGPNGYTASIPASAFKAGDLVRWFVKATDGGGNVSQSPPDDGGAEYFGTVIADPSVTATLPIMHWFTDNVTGSVTEEGASGSAVYWLGRFYDNIRVRRKGVTSLTWPKPKLKFNLPEATFVLRDPPQSALEVPVKKFELNSIWWEPGQPSYMREGIGYKVMSEMGLPTPIYEYITIYRNGQYYGMHALEEDQDAQWLKRTNRSADGILIESSSGDQSNLRWDVSVDQLPFYYELQESQVDDATTWGLLAQLTYGIAGGNGPRSKWVFDNIDVPEVINYMAVATMLLYQDRCTKNWYILRDNSTGLWSLLPKDVKTALGADSGLGGSPAPDYCILECEQWNSPLYCDRNHPQDLPQSQQAPWTSITTQSLTGRRLAQTGGRTSGPNSLITSLDPDEDLTKQGPTKTGAAGTFNYLEDLILAVPATRAAYLRRLRSVTDYYHSTRRLLQMVTELYNQIRTEAKRDNAKWYGGDIDYGYQQLTTEQIPKRKAQLYGKYGPGGPQALLPDAQPALTGVVFGRIDASASPAQQYVEVVNPTALAVDLTGWQLTGSVSAPIRPGTVIPPRSSLFLTTDVNGFRERSSPPTKGQGHLVQGGLSGPLSAANGLRLNLVDASGKTAAVQSGPSQGSAAG